MKPVTTLDPIPDIRFYPTWPGLWLMGNLGRALFAASTNRMWPWTYNECTELSRKNQRISACNDNPGYGLNPNQGRGSPEIDILEGGGTAISSSVQIAPGMPDDYRLTTPLLKYENSSNVDAQGRHGGFIEIAMKLPGATNKGSQNPHVTGQKWTQQGMKPVTTLDPIPDIRFYPTWPGLWLMGNLGRALFAASTNRMWPWTYNECTELSRKNQRISACDDNPGYGLNPYQGRGSPEIDILEGGGTAISSSVQIAPGMPDDYRLTTPLLNDDDCTVVTSFTGRCVDRRCSCVTAWTGPRCTKYSIGGSSSYGPSVSLAVGLVAFVVVASLGAFIIRRKRRGDTTLNKQMAIFAKAQREESRNSRAAI
ncbi:hypothetical protein SDRG_07575 [Saprolegnia diclina VS20]|uniref:EGF-like domain-containing protein n=1 Tax=Saprolegnia diclina (strain VS20) TaxID=1156394 RepID=T0RWN3_SAPDV|nr:hypothetical protein SDRG_07575 [Saprolegnia diclina VS20]EQC34767.1 hypothetical protein SDRG_07575 [Saprolegnia diclina VS20]|eukprot:XP_008611639.1 hypothetical protein SDRG_07575 [Saprolegnia diclina VS20]